MTIGDAIAVVGGVGVVGFVMLCLVFGPPWNRNG